MKSLKRLIIGAPRDPLDQKTRHSIALTALFAWIGLGADGLSSSCYGPQEAYLALGHHTQLALYLAIATALTVFIISFAYNQVIELFPGGGGGYKVATKLIGPNAGLVAGAALIVDYVLTIVISIASGSDAFFSMLPMAMHVYKLRVETVLVILLMILNLRGMKESIKILMPVFMGFIVTHLFMITYGIARHGAMLPVLVTNAVHETSRLAMLNGGIFVAALFLHAYSIGGGTYTGLEAVSNNVNTLAEPRVRTGKWTMFFMAVSLSITAGGIIILYLLWHAAPQPGQTLNAVVFRSLLSGWHYATPIVMITLVFEFGLLFVGANTGFLGGPAVLANMAMDHWVPNKFRNLSNRLVTQNGVVLFGIAAIVLLNVTHGAVGYLVILYSINVFLAFMVSIFGLCKYWWKQRGNKGWLRRLSLSLVGFIICTGILLVVVISRFTDGGWEAILITGGVIAACYFVRNHYRQVNKKLREADKIFREASGSGALPADYREHAFDVNAPTAVFFIAKSRGAAMHTVLWAQRYFPDYFKNFIFISVGVVDVKSYGAETALEKMKLKVESNLSYFVNFSRRHNIPVRSYSAYGTDPVEQCIEIAEKVNKEIPSCIYFASQLMMDTDNWFTRQLHNETAFAVQRRLYLTGRQMMIMPMKL